MKNAKKKLLIIATIVCLCVLGTSVVADPGTDSDPLVSKSYVDNVLIPQIQKMIDSSVSGIQSVPNTSGGDYSKFVVVEASKGDEIICAAGTELILRMGSASVIATEKGGIADTTAGYDLGNGWQMPSNHLLVVPVADGRGIKAESDVIIMIKGGYSVR